MLLGLCHLLCMNQISMVDLFVLIHSIISKISHVVDHDKGLCTSISGFLQYIAGVLWRLYGRHIENLLLLILLLSRLVKLTWNESNEAIIDGCSV